MQKQKNLYNTYTAIFTAIVKEQQHVIGPIALIQAKNVPGIIVKGDEITLDPNVDAKSTLELLVRQYSELFGRASIELSKEAVNTLKPQPGLLPDILL